MDATNKTSKKLIRFLGDNAITLCLVVLVVVIICINPKFFSFNVLRDVLLQNATKLIMACGMMFVLISGGVDLSAGRILGLAAVLTASLGQTIDYSRRFYPNMPDIPIIVPFLVALAVCMLLGLFNGTVIAKFAIPPFIVTLGTQVIAWGVNLLYFDLPPNSSQPIGGVKKSITYMGSGLLGGQGAGHHPHRAGGHARGVVHPQKAALRAQRLRGGRQRRGGQRLGHQGDGHADRRLRHRRTALRARGLPRVRADGRRDLRLRPQL